MQRLNYLPLCDVPKLSYKIPNYQSDGRKFSSNIWGISIITTNDSCKKNWRVGGSDTSDIPQRQAFCETFGNIISLYIYIYTVSSTKAVVFCSFYIAATANGSPTLRHISDKPTLVSSHPIRSNPLMMCRSLRGGNSPLNRRELAAPPGGSSRSSGFGSYSWTDRVGSRRRRRSTPAPFTRGSRLATRGVKGTGSSSSSAAR